MIDVAVEQISDSNHRVRFKFPSYGQGQVSGIERVAQKFVKILLTTIGSDKFFPSIGGGLSSAVGKTISGAKYREEVESIIIEAVSSTEKQLKNIQSGQVLRRDETFTGATIKAIEVDRSSLGVACSIRITTLDNNKDVTVESSLFGL